MKRASIVLVLAVAALTGCITRSLKEVVFEEGTTTVVLRSQRRWSTTLEKGFSHPLAISSARMSHILSRIDLRSEDAEEQRKAAIPLDSLYLIGDGVSQALGKANANQEVVVMSVRRDKRWGLFDRNYLTSLVVYGRDDLLYIHISRVDWEIPRELETGLPEPRVDDEAMKFRLVADDAMVLVGPQAVAVTWRDPVFKRPSRTRILPSGKVVRREILMESPEDTPPPPLATDVLPANLAPQTLRELADLEEAKKRGEVTQAQYNARREEILRADPSVGD